MKWTNRDDKIQAAFIVLILACAGLGVYLARSTNDSSMIPLIGWGVPLIAFALGMIGTFAYKAIRHVYRKYQWRDRLERIK